VAARSPSARRYAEAIFDIASETGAAEQWRGDLESLAAFAGEADVAAVLSSNRVPRDEKLRLMNAGLEGHVGPLAMNLVRLLVEKDKLHLAPQIRDIFQEKLDESRGIAHAVVTTAVPLSDDERTAVTRRLSTLTGKQVEITPVVDEGIIGGLVARIGDQLIDGSTRTRLLALKRQLASVSR
jgi:F-type H+-transporting ATPase subunit delta